MKFIEKLERLSADVNKSQRGQEVGLGPSTISNYLAKKSIPRADIGIKIARALKVPADWLFDDAADWPPPPVDTRSLESASADELMRVVARRYRTQALEADRILSAAEAVDVEELSRQILEVPVDQELPGELSSKVEALRDAGPVLRKTIDNYLPSRWMEEHHTELPADEQIADELDEETLLKRWIRNEDRWGTWQGLSDYLEARTLARKHRLTSVLESARSMKFPRLLPPDEHAGLLYKAFMYAIGVRFPEDDKPQPKDPRIKEISRFLLEAEDTLQKEKGGVDAGEPKPKTKKKSTKAKRR